MSLKKAAPHLAKITAIEPLESGKWIQTRSIQYNDPSGKPRLWEMAVRTTRTSSVDAVLILAILRSKTLPKRVVITKQFRPPTEKVVLELPAGLVDPKESIKTTALRELVEETGYHGTFVSESPVVYSDPGLTNANMLLARVDVDADLPENQDPQAQLEDGEFIEVFTVSFETMLEELQAVCEKEGAVIDARLYHFAHGLALAKEFL